MGSPSKWFFAVTCCSVFTVVRIYATLVLLQHPIDNNSRTQNYTCMSDEARAALIWRVDGNENLADKDFKPKRPASGNVRDCAVRDDSTCLAEWDNTSDWELVNSLEHPTDPVFDNRFEDFPEFGSLLPNQLWRYQKVAVLNNQTGNSSRLWFSVEERRENSFGIVLCEKEELHEGPCLVIRRNDSRIYAQLVRLGPGDYYGNISGTTYETVTRTPTSWFFNPNGHGWQTFRLEWNTEKGIIWVPLGGGSRTWMRIEIPKWDKISALGTYTELNDHRIRFHFYDYYRSHTQNAVISTKRFAHSGKLFCAELLVGFCEGRCTISVTLMNEYTRENKVHESRYKTWYITNPESKLRIYQRIWRIVKVETELNNDRMRYLRLRIEVISNEKQGSLVTGWEIDNFRICAPVPGSEYYIHPLGVSYGKRFEKYTRRKEVRESTITLASGKDAICQKLSNTESSTVNNSDSTSNEAEALLEMQELLYYQNRQFVGRGGFICNPKGCICDQGFTGSKCEDECKDGFHGFICTEKCGSCRNSEACVKSTGYCEKGCLRDDMIKPFCKTALDAPTVEDVGLTSATLVLRGEVPEESKEDIDIAIQIQEVGGESWMNFTTELKDSEGGSFRYESHATGLKPNTTYRTRTVVTAKKMNSVPILTFGSGINWTTCLEPETISLVAIRRNEESQIPINLVNPFSLYVTDELTNKVVFSAFSKSFPVNVTGQLSPSTEYGLKIVDTMNECTLIDTRLHISESDCEIDSHEYYDCKEKCGSCLDAGNCKQTTGSCPDECKGPKIAPFCHIALSIVKKPPADKTYLAWLAIIPVLAVCLPVLFIWYRKRRAALNEQPRERGREDPPLVPDRSTGFPASEVSIPLQQNGEHDQLTMSHTKNDTNMNKDSYENSS